MATQRKLRRGTAAEMAAFTGGDGEVTFETDTGDLVFHDGATAGGKHRHLTAQRLRDQKATFAVAGGTANALTLTLSPALAGRATGTRVSFKAAANNTGAATLNVDGTGAGALKKAAIGGVFELDGGDIRQDAIYDATWNGAVWIIGGGVGGAGGRVLVSDADVSSASVVIANLEDGYDYEIEFEFAATAAGYYVSAQVSTDNGSTWVTTGYSYAVVYGAATPGAGNAAAFDMMNNVAAAMVGRLELSAPAVAARKTQMRSAIAGAFPTGGTGVCMMGTAVVHNAVKLYHTGGSTLTGHVTVWKIKR